MVVDLQHRSMLRTAPEEFNLAANMEPHDVLAAEFKRTYSSVTFPGGRLVRLYEAQKNEVEEKERLRTIPVRKGEVTSETLMQYDLEDVYGYRGRDPRVYYLNPWEFLMYWEPIRYDKALVAELGEHHADIIIFPEKDVLKWFRVEWMLRRRLRPYVPQPEHTPMP